MMYIRTSKRPGERRSQAIAIVVGTIVSILIAIQLIVPHFIPAIFTTIVRPFWRIEFSIQSGSLQSPAALLAENQALKIELQAIIAQNASMSSIQAENAEILSVFGRTSAVDAASSSSQSSTTETAPSPNASSTFDMASFIDRFGGSHLLAAVLSRPPFAPYDELIVDTGANQGVTVGSNVYAPGNILIGTVADVLGETSKVALLSSPGQTYPVLIGSSHVPATATGRGGGQYQAQVPQATAIAQGDIVSDASIDDGAFGTVTSVIDNPADPFETVLFAPPVNIYELRWVLIDSDASIVSYIKTTAMPKNISATTSRSSASKH
jgi:cell shape-determining protein MreC